MSDIEQIDTLPGISPRGKSCRREAYNMLERVKLASLLISGGMVVLSICFPYSIVWGVSALSVYMGYETYIMSKNLQRFYTTTPPNSGFSRGSFIDMMGRGTFVAMSLLKTFAPQDLDKNQQDICM